MEGLSCGVLLKLCKANWKAQMEKQCWVTCLRSLNIMKFGIFVELP
jgi:hypothetical protein